MKLTRCATRLRSLKFAPFSIIALFLFTNVTGIFFGHVIAPQEVQAHVITVDVDNYIPADVPSSGDHNLDLLIMRAGKRYGVDPRLLHAVIWQESKYKADAKSGAGAEGLMQLMSATAKRFKCEDRSDAEANIEAGTKYLRWLLKRFDGNVTLALAGYNAGEGSVDKYEGVPPFNETQNYVRIITERYGKTYHPIVTPEESLTEFNLTPQVAVLQQP